MSEVLKKFGRYFLLDLIAQGGMAEIYRARLASKEGAGRLLVIKRIQAGFGGNNEFLQMFKSETKTTMGFNHANVVQLYDFGEENNQPFIAMELVDGKNLRQFLSRFNEMKQSFPVELAAHIIEQSALGLHYAHTFKDKISGEPMNIVHRDISPQNILISYEGNVKVIDFGIAKAASNSESTRAGVIKGKPSYLSPEQISGDLLDGRTDLFALGAVFWELLAGKKLFSGESDLAVLKLIESCTTTVRPPSEVNPNVPKELDEIVMKLLQKNPDRRYQNGEELARALRRFLVTYAPDFSPSDISHVAKEIFNKEIVEDRKKIQRLNDRVEQLLLNEVPVVNITPDPAGLESPEDTTTHVAAVKPSVPGPAAKPVEFHLEKDVVAQKFTVEPAPPTPQRPRPASLNTGVSPVGKTSGGTRYTQSSYQTRSTQHTPTSTSRPVRDVDSSVNWFGWAAMLAAVIGASYVGPKMGYEVPVLSKLLGAVKPTKPTSTDTSVQTPPDLNTAQNPVGNTSTSTAKLRLNVFPSGTDGTISINGKTVDPANPVVEVPADSLLELAIARPGFEEFRSEFTIDSRVAMEDGEYVKEVTLSPDRSRAPAQVIEGDNFGYVTVLSTPTAEVTIFVNGKMWERKLTPVERLQLPAGKVELKFYNATLDLEDKTEFSLGKGQSRRVTSNLKPVSSAKQLKPKK